MGKKTIYRGRYEGLFIYGAFQKFMGSLVGCTHVLERFNLDGNLFQIYHYNDVTIHYANDGQEIIAQVKIDLHGSEENISKVEKIIRVKTTLN